MNILFMNGSDAGSALDAYARDMAAEVTAAGHTARELTLREMEYTPCRGCFHCWLKTPGLCMYKDDGDTICRAFLAADCVVLVAPVIMGYPAARVKNALDRVIPLVHPWLVNVDGEIHHVKRYEKYPQLALLMEKNAATDDEDIAIITELFQRAALNLQSSLKMAKTSETPAKEAAHEIINN